MKQNETNLSQSKILWYTEIKDNRKTIILFITVTFSWKGLLMVQLTNELYAQIKSKGLIIISILLISVWINTLDKQHSMYCTTDSSNMRMD